MLIRLGWKLGLTYLVLIVMSVGVFGYFTMNFFEQSFLNEKKAALFTQANILANRSAPYLRDPEQKPYLNYLARDLAERVGNRLLVLNDQGQVVADSAGELKGRVLSHQEILAALQGENTAEPHLETQYGWVLYLAVPVYSGKQVNGAVFLSADINPLVAQLDEIRKRLLWFSAASGAVVFVISLFLGTFITRPITGLIKAAKSIASGDYGYRIKGNARNDELGELTGVFNEMSSKIQTEDTIRKQFVADASHEMKSPLAAIQALLDSYPEQGQYTQAQISELIKDLKIETDRLRTLVEDLLVLSRIEGNIRRLSCEETSVGEVTEAVKKAVMPLARSRDIEIETIHSGDIYWPMDGEKMFRALANLLDNAVKYSYRPGKVFLSFKVNEEWLNFYITNKGEGIPPDEIQNIFKRFYRIDKARSRETGGWGLGLAIVKEIVELHEGNILVNSEPEGETVFQINLPPIT